MTLLMIIPVLWKARKEAVWKIPQDDCKVLGSVGVSSARSVDEAKILFLEVK